jgi:hypothetical protein
MLDGREPNLETQARNAIRNHAQSDFVSYAELERIASFEHTAGFFSSRELRRFARGGPAPELPEGHTESEIRGRRFFADAFSAEDLKLEYAPHVITALCSTKQIASHLRRLPPE